MPEPETMPARPAGRRVSRFDRFPTAAPGPRARLLWLCALTALAVGLVSWGTGTLQGGVIALWAFSVGAVLVALVLPWGYAAASPLFMGIFGWLVDMLPFVILAGWAAFSLRWLFCLLKERRWPRGGRFVWLGAGLLVWTALGILVITPADFKHFLLLVGIQFVISATVLAVVDQMEPLDEKRRAASGLAAFAIVLSVAVLLQWVGVNIQALQNGTVRRRVEAAYGVDAFPNSIGMIKYARSVKSGSLELTRQMKQLREREPELPQFVVFRPKFQAYENSLVVRFRGSARAFEDVLAQENIRLIFDNVGVAPANTVPRLRSFPRNALTYAGFCAAILPLAFFLLWSARTSRRRWFGRVAIASCLFGVGFSLARGAWAAVILGFLYLAFDGTMRNRFKVQYIASVLLAALVLTSVFLIKYDVDPLSGRAGGGASVSTRGDLYQDTFGSLKGKYLIFGYGTEQPRTESGTVREGEGRRYVPRAGTHSTYLNYFFRTGVPGALMILALYLIAWLHARSAARVRDGDERLFANAAATALTIAGAHAVILSLYVEPIYSLAISLLLGLGVAGNSHLPRSLFPWRGSSASSTPA